MKEMSLVLLNLYYKLIAKNKTQEIFMKESLMLV
jgi:hypothetical protein